MPLNKFSGFTNYGDIGLNENLEWTVIAFINWAFLNIGAFDDVTLNMNTSYGGHNDVLQHVDDYGFYSDGQVWQGFRANWVWETGIDYQYQPIQISGLYVNSQFLPLNTTGASGYFIDYPNGRVVFNNPLPINSLIQIEYSYRNVYICNSEQSWFKALMYGSYRADDWNFLIGSGIYQKPGIDRLQLPAIVVEMVPRREFHGYELGSNKWVKQDILFHILAETKYDRNNLIDILSYQQDTGMYINNLTTLISNDKLPLDVNGSPVSGFITYPQWQTQPYIYGKFYIEDVTTNEIGVITPLLYGGQVRWTANCVGFV